MGKFNITVVRQFEAPPQGSKYVVFMQEEPYISEESAFEHLKKAIKYSRFFKVYTVPLRFIRDDRITMCMISPEGEILGAQEAVHLSLAHRGNLSHSEDISIITTEDASFFLCVDVDIFHPEVSRAASLMGAQVLICSRFMDIINDTPHRVCQGCENTAISNKLYLLDATEEGGRFINPMSITECVRRTKTPGRINTIWECDTDKLNAFREENPILPQNTLFKKYIDYLVR